MGRPSDTRRKARRLGKRERARVKSRRRGSSSCYVGGAGHFHVKAGRKKHGKVANYCLQVLQAHLEGDSATLKSGETIKRPLYTVVSANLQARAA